MKMKAILLAIAMFATIFTGLVMIPSVGVSAVDVIGTASLPDSESLFEQGISETGVWIITPLKDLTFTKALELKGSFNSKKATPAPTGTPVPLQRKIGLYEQDANRVITKRFTLTCPLLTIDSPNSSLEKGFFIGDLYVKVDNFKMIDQKVTGNIYFATESNKTTFDIKFAADGKSIVTGSLIVGAPPSATPTPTPTPTPTATPTPTVTPTASPCTSTPIPSMTPTPKPSATPSVPAPIVKTFVVGATSITGFAVKGAGVFAKIGTKLYYGMANASTGVFVIKTPKLIKGVTVIVTAKVGVKYSKNVVIVVGQGMK